MTFQVDSNGIAEKITDYTAEEILDAFQEHQEAYDGYLEDVWSNEGPDTYRWLKDEDGAYMLGEATATGYRPALTEKIDFLLRGVPTEVTSVDSTGGEDQGSGASVTFQIGSQFFRKFGYYASHYGYDWDGDFVEVFPHEVTRVEYRREPASAAA